MQDECEHDYEKKEELIRRVFDEQQENKLHQYNKMFPGNYLRPLSATLTVKVCKKCSKRVNVSYMVNK